MGGVFHQQQWQHMNADTRFSMQGLCMAWIQIQLVPVVVLPPNGYNGYYSQDTYGKNIPAYCLQA